MYVVVNYVLPECRAGQWSAASGQTRMPLAMLPGWMAERPGVMVVGLYAV